MKKKTLTLTPSSTMLLLQLLLLIISSTVWETRGMTITRSLSSFAGVGVTSILPIPTTKESLYDEDIDTDNLLSFYVGTKRGKMKKVTMNSKTNTHNDDYVHIQCIEEEQESAAAKTPYPIFSMMSLSSIHNHYHHVLSGSGDRYITIWEEVQDHKQQHQDDGGVPPWRIKAKLGPHTGWVKDLASSIIISPYSDAAVDDDQCHTKQEEEETFIFSIGCNCIEVWRTVNGQSYDHVHKLMIESSLEMGSTLSSDILCLATSPSYHYDTTSQSNEKETQQDHHSYYLLAGGVDGRIHQWTILCNNDSSSFQDATVVCAPGHNGRVNALLVCNTLRTAVSIGNDGFVKVWRLDCNKSLVEQSSINVNDVYVGQDDTKTQEAIKLTCCCILLETENLVIIAIGTACGKVFLAEISKDTRSELISITLLDERTVVVESSSLSSSSSSGSNGGCTIHSIASQNNIIIIGHSKGISIWEPGLHILHRYKNIK